MYEKDQSFFVSNGITVGFCYAFVATLETAPDGWGVGLQPN